MRPVGQRQRQALRRRPGQPQRRVAAVEVHVQPLAYELSAERPDGRLPEPGKPHTSRAVPLRQQRTEDRMRDPAILGAQHVRLDAEPVEGELCKHLADPSEESDHSRGAARRGELGRVEVDTRVALEAGAAERAHREVFDEVRKPAAGERLVASADREHQSGSERRRGVHPQHRDPVDQRLLHAVHRRSRALVPSCSLPARVMAQSTLVTRLEQPVHARRSRPR